MKKPPGFSLPELTLMIAIGGIVCGILTAAFSSAQRVARLYGERVARAEARRVAATILAAEIRYLAPSIDLRGVGRDSIALRAFRGTAVVCALSGDGTALVRYRGLRAPEPAKDSVVSVGWAGGGGGGSGGGKSGGGHAGISGPRALQLLTSTTASDGCPPHAAESLYHWTLASAPMPGTLLLLFESGSYHLTGSALRYRRGESGRQPLTAELFDDDGMRLGWIPLAEGGGAGAGGGDHFGEAGIELVLASKPGGAGLASTGSRSTRYWIGVPR